MIKFKTYLKNEYLRLLRQLTIVNIDCLFCKTKSAKSFSNLYKCADCEINELKYKDLDFYLSKLKDNWNIINYYPDLFNVEIEYNKHNIIIYVSQFDKEIETIEFSTNNLKKEYLNYIDWLNSNTVFEIPNIVIDYFKKLAKEVNQNEN